jgi:TolA-binding protein
MMTLRNTLAGALREALAAEPTPGIGEDDALITRAVARATTRLAAPTKATSADSSSKFPASNSVATTSSVTESARHLKIVASSPRAVRFALPLAAAFAASLAMAAVYVSSSEHHGAPASGSATAEHRVDPAPVPARPSVAAAEPVAEPPAETAQPSNNSPAETATEPSISVNDLPSAKPLAVVTSDTVSFSPPSPPADSPVTAAELFRDANAERRAGHIEKAVELYRSLQKRYPEAPETQASRVSLGRLLLDRQDNPSGALAQFDAYLAGAPADGGSLAEEARVGRALAFEHLGRQDDERRAWEELMARHPQSLHASRARERLAALGTP